jgi:hypothetical protein
MQSDEAVGRDEPRSSDGLSLAAAELGRLRKGYRRNRHRKKLKTWTGYLADGQRAWRGLRVILPNGRIALIYGVVRGWVGVTWDDPAAREGLGMARLRVEEVTPYKLPAAVALGRGKRGKKERPSIAKRLAAQANGCMPTRSGKKRGRPRKLPLTSSIST